MTFTIILVILFCLFIIALWWVLPIIASVRTLKRGEPFNNWASVIIQLTGVSAVWGWLLYGVEGAVGYAFFPPFWLVSSAHLTDWIAPMDLSLSRFFATSTITLVATAMLLLWLTKLKPQYFFHVTIILPLMVTTLVGLRAMNPPIQDAIEKRATELGATCLVAKPIWVSILSKKYGPQSAHARARLGGELIYWSYRKQDFYPGGKLNRQMPDDWCPNW